MRDEVKNVLFGDRGRFCGIAGCNTVHVNVTVVWSKVYPCLSTSKITAKSTVKCKMLSTKPGKVLPVKIVRFRLGILGKPVFATHISSATFEKPNDILKDCAFFREVR